MELLLIIFEGVAWILDVLFFSADVYSWIKGKENRVERKDARKAGREVPPRDNWNRRVVVLTALVCVITVGLILWKKSKGQP